METANYKSFAYLENGDVHFSQYATIKSTKILEPGSYKLNCDGYPKFNIILKMDLDCESSKIHNFAGKNKIDYIFNAFFNKEVSAKIQSLGFYHKLGILLYGTEGTGKSTIIKHYYSKAITENKAIVIHMVCSDESIDKCWEFVQDVRKIQDNPIIVVFDEFDQQMTKNEAFLKTVIDGNMSINNCIFFAATNYLQKIPKAMSERPSRFKYCLEIKGLEEVEDIKMIVTSILEEKRTEEEIERISETLKGSTLDNVKQYCFDKLMEIEHHKHNNEKTKIGFKNN